MTQRYNVYHGDRLFAVVHARRVEQAVLLACAKTDGHHALDCTAVATYDVVDNLSGVNP
jgi:hypothetical protein